MIEIGNLALWLALAASLYAVVASIYGAIARRRDFVASAEHAAHATCALVAIASVVLVHALITHDFSIKYVASYSSTTLPVQYRFAALWGGMEGSMLFWALILTSFLTGLLVEATKPMPSNPGFFTAR